MKLIRLLIMLTAFLVMISSAITLFSTTDRTPVYINIAAMCVLIVIITILNFQKNKGNNQDV
jgi:divalent metal cation (Fe/Co/Zn/Cd) transporter